MASSDGGSTRSGDPVRAPVQTLNGFATVHMIHRRRSARRRSRSSRRNERRWACSWMASTPWWDARRRWRRWGTQRAPAETVPSAVYSRIFASWASGRRPPRARSARGSRTPASTRRASTEERTSPGRPSPSPSSRRGRLRGSPLRRLGRRLRRQNRQRRARAPRSDGSSKRAAALSATSPRFHRPVSASRSTTPFATPSGSTKRGTRLAPSPPSDSHRERRLDGRPRR